MMRALSVMVFALPVLQQETMEELAARWRQDNPAARESASKEIVRRWKTWTDRDLESLEALKKAVDPETASRAAGALRAIRTLRTFGEQLYPKIEQAEALLEEHRVSGAPVELHGWASPGGPLFSSSEPMKKLAKLGSDIEPFVRTRLSDPVLRNDIAVVLAAIGTPDSLPALIDALPGKEGNLTAAESLTFTCVVHTLYVLTGAPIGINSRDEEPYSPEIRARWQRWHDERKEFLYKPSASDPTVDHRWIGSGIILDAEAWAQTIPTREYRKTHPFVSYAQVKTWEESPEYERRLREFCLQHLLRSLWRNGTWNTDGISVAGDVQDARILAVLRRIAADKDVEDFTLNRTAFALWRQGPVALADLEELVKNHQGKELRYLQIPLTWAKLEQKLAGRRFSRRVEIEQAALLLRCIDEEAARKELVGLLGRGSPSSGVIEIAAAVPDPEVVAALKALMEKETAPLSTRMLAATSLGKEGMGFLRARLGDQEPAVRLRAAEGLWKGSNREGFPALLELVQLRPLEDGNSPSGVHTTTPPKEGSSLAIVRRACEILGEMGDRAAVELLKKLLSENLNGVRGMPKGSTGTGWYGRPDVVALARLGDFSGIEILSRSAQNGDPLGTAGTHGVTGDYQVIGIKRLARDLLPVLEQGESFDRNDLFAARSILHLLDKGR